MVLNHLLHVLLHFLLGLVDLLLGPAQGRVVRNALVLVRWREVGDVASHCRALRLRLIFYQVLDLDADQVLESRKVFALPL